MTRGIQVVIAVTICGALAVGAAACGGGAARDASAGGDSRAELTRLRGLLREGASHLPDGFSARPRDGWVPPFRAVNQDCRLLLDAAAGAGAGPGGARVAATYPGDRLGELAGVSMASYAGQGAGLRFAELTRALDGCRVARNSLAGRGTVLRVSRLRLGDTGAEVQARRLRGRLNGYPYEMHVVFALTGNTLVSLVHTGVAGVDAGRTGQLTRSLVGGAAS
ncbi:hypothetical protein ABT340_01165 [Streptosporangium sp. NPDC000239]|uniref:hypothetical protein n=1 Tax=Streptosporangium sp. NPDC000239 TaxID=3154248 RepID=UPI00332B5D73